MGTTTEMLMVKMLKVTGEETATLLRQLIDEQRRTNELLGQLLHLISGVPAQRVSQIMSEEVTVTFGP